MPRTVDEELVEVPADIQLAIRVRLGFFQELVKRMGLVPVDLDLVEKGERDVVFGGTEGLDLLVAAGLLGVELVAGEAQDHETLSLVFLIKLFQTRVLRGKAAFAGHVHDQQYLALVFGQGNHVAVDIPHFERINRVGLHFVRPKG